MLDDQSKERINQKVEEVTGKAVTQMTTAIRSIGFSSSKKTAARFRKRDELINRIGFTFPKPVIFREKGAGKGRGGVKGSQWKNSQGQIIKTNPKSLNKMNTGNRRAKPLIDPIIDNYTDELTEAVAGEFVTLSFKNINIK